MTTMDTDRDYGLLAAKVQIGKGRYREALDLLARLPTETPEEEAHKLVLSGQGYEGLDDSWRAHHAYARARTLAPSFPAPILRQGVLHYLGGDREGARRLLYRYVQLEPGNPEAFYYLALCEQDPPRRANFVRTLVLLDSPTSTWSSELFRALGG
jgi:Flp pilus assembly protein TadD